MLNKKPIFINGFARGGSNILVNFFLSSPDVCLSNGETHKVFKGRARTDNTWSNLKKKYLYDYPIRALAGQDVFNAHGIFDRKPVPNNVKNYIDKILYKSKFAANIEGHNMYKGEGSKYSQQEIQDARLLTKGLNGLTYTVEMFREMYPDATFFGLVRNGLAVCEGRIRRGFPSEKMAFEYKEVVSKMLQYKAEMPNYHIVKYEDMVTKPHEFIQDIYQLADLDFSKVDKIRLESKATLGKDGKHTLSKGTDRQVFWYDQDKINEHIRSDINENQIKNLDPKEKEKFLGIAGEVMEKIGYEV